MRDFDQDEARLEAFLAHCDHPARIAWTFAEDFAWVDRILYVDKSNLTRNREATIAAYRSPDALRYGVELSLVACVADTSLCSILVPRSQREAHRLLITDVKLRAPLHLPAALLVACTSRWPELANHTTRPSPVDDLMSKRRWLAAVSG